MLKPDQTFASIMYCIKENTVGKTDYSDKREWEYSDRDNPL